MIGVARSHRFRARLVGPAAAVVLAIFAGAALFDENRARYLQMSPAARRELAESLRRFDERLGPDRQRAARAIDDRLGAMPPEERDAHLSTLRRHHNWLATLPEPIRDELLSTPTSERLDRMRSLFAKYPPPGEEARSALDFVPIGGVGIFEVASLCKTWIEITPQDRKRIGELPKGDRRAELHRIGRELEIPLALVPDDFSMEVWVNRAEPRIKELREGASNQNDWIGKLEGRINAAAERLADGKPRVSPFLHGLAVNLYLREHKPAHPVDPVRLSRFLEAMPPWIQSSFYPFPSDEAKRRLTFVYRQVFPRPEEFGTLGSGRPSAAPDASAAPPETAPPPAPSPRKTAEPAPF